MTEEDKIEQRVILSDQVRTGDITVIGKIVYGIKNPAKWQEATWDFLTRHRYFVALTAVLELSLAVVYWHFKNMYLISMALWASAAVLLAVTAWGYRSWIWSRRSLSNLSLSAIGTLALGGLIAWHAWHIIYPTRFDAQVFGIAMAELGEGPDYNLTKTSRLLTDGIYETLLQAVQHRGKGDVGDRLGTEGSPGRRIEVRRIGVITSSEVARAYGQQIGAEIMIWGQVVSSEPQGTVIRFYVLETLDKAENPDFPFVMAVTVKSTDVSVRELNLGLDPVKIKQTVAGQSQLISSFVLGLVSYLDQDFATTVPQLTYAIEAVQSNPALQASPEGQALLYYYLGTALHRQGRDKEGQNFLLQAQAMNPEEPAIPLSLAFDYRHLGMKPETDAYLDRAFDLLNKWLSSHPDDTTALYDRGVAHYLREETNLEILDYQQIIKVDPDFYIAYINLGRAYTDLGRFSEAEETLARAIGLAGEKRMNSGMAWLKLAQAREKAGDVEAARAAYLEATSRLPLVPWTHYYYAQFLEKQNELDGAMLAYERALEVHLDKAWAYTEAGSFARRAGLFSQALVYYQQAVAIDPTDSWARTYLAETYHELGDWGNARIQFEKAIDSANNSPYPYSSYAWHLYQEAEYQKAAEMYEQSLARQPMAENELRTLARIYVKLGKCQKARHVYSEILAAGQRFSVDTLQEAETNLKALEAGCTEKPD